MKKMMKSKGMRRGGKIKSKGYAKGGKTRMAMKSKGYAKGGKARFSKRWGNDSCFPTRCSQEKRL